LLAFNAHRSGKRGRNPRAIDRRRGFSARRPQTAIDAKPIIGWDYGSKRLERRQRRIHLPFSAAFVGNTAATCDARWTTEGFGMPVLSNCANCCGGTGRLK
jgi:hypothetical protein